MRIKSVVLALSLFVFGILVAAACPSCTMSRTAGIAKSAGTPATQPLTFLAGADKVVGEIGAVATNPAIVAASTPIPLAPLILGIIGTLAGVYASIRSHLPKGTASTPPATAATVPKLAA